MKNYFLASLLLVSLNAQAMFSNLGPYAKTEQGRKGIYQQLSPSEQILAAAYFGDIQQLKMAAKEARVDINYQDSTTGYTALHEAINSSGSAEMVQFLLTCKQINSNVQAHSGFTPLHSAVLKNNISIVKLLLAANADISLKDTTWGRTVFDLAEERNHVEILEVLNTYKQAQTEPTQITLDKAIEHGLDFLVSKLLKVMSTCYEQQQHYARVAKKKYLEAKQNGDTFAMQSYRAIGSMLRERMGLVGLDLCLSRTGLVREDTLPHDVVALICKNL